MWFAMLTPGRVRYYFPLVLAGDDLDAHEEACAERGETALHWIGYGAGELGLRSHVRAGDFWEMFGPGGARRDGRRLVDSARAGVELVCSQPKSVSVLCAYGRTEHALDILAADVRTQMDWLDRCCLADGGRHGRRAERTTTGGLTAAITYHLASRAGDPHVHAHVIVANVVRTPHGYRCLDSRWLAYHLAEAAERGRQAAADLARHHGYDVELVPTIKTPSSWRIRGVPSDAEETFSRRASEISRHQRQRSEEGLGSHKEVARIFTARHKHHHSIERLHRSWQEQADALGRGTCPLPPRADHRPGPSLAPDRGGDILAALRLVADEIDSPLSASIGIAAGIAASQRRHPSQAARPTHQRLE